MAELTRLLSKSLSEAIRFSTSRNMYQSCLKSLGITKSSEIEETVHNHLKKWNPDSNNGAEQSDVSRESTSSTSHIV
jgi:hypothetical protein